MIPFAMIIYALGIMNGSWQFSVMSIPIAIFDIIYCAMCWESIEKMHKRGGN